MTLSPDPPQEDLVPMLRQAIDLLSRFPLDAPARKPPLLSVDEVATYLNVSRRSVEQIIADGDLVPLHVRSSRRFTQEAIDAYLRRGRSR